MQPREVKSDKQSPKAVLRARLLPCRAMQYEKCYVYSPEDARPAKRRRVEPQGLQASWGVRHKAYKKAWQARQKEIDVCNSEPTAQLSTLISTGKSEGRE